MTISASFFFAVVDEKCRPYFITFANTALTLYLKNDENKKENPGTKKLPPQDNDKKSS